MLNNQSEVTRIDRWILIHTNRRGKSVTNTYKRALSKWILSGGTEGD